MLVIRETQISALTGAMTARFDFDALAHVQLYFSERCAALGNDRAMEWVRDGLKRARGYGFESKYDWLRYLNLLFHFGDGFELCPAHAWALPYLEGERPARIRMNLLMDEAYRRLYTPAPQPKEEAPREFDGLMWEAKGVDPKYVPTSIRPEILPLPPAPRPGSFAGEQSHGRS
jgi:hypothetical protein